MATAQEVWAKEAQIQNKIDDEKLKLKAKEEYKAEKKLKGILLKQQEDFAKQKAEKKIAIDEARNSLDKMTPEELEAVSDKAFEQSQKSGTTTNWKDNQTQIRDEIRVNKSKVENEQLTKDLGLEKIAKDLN